MKKEDITIRTVEKSIKHEFNVYKAEQIAKGAEEVFSNVFRINAWSCIYDFLQDDELTNEKKIALYKKCKGYVIAILVDEYMDKEYCDIAKNEDIKELVDDFLSSER